MKINVNEAINDSDRIQSLPSRVGVNKSVLKSYGGPLGCVWDRRKLRREDPYYDIRSQIMRSSIGMNWDKVVELLISKVPAHYAQEHPYFIDKPDVMVQNSVTGFWHWQDSGGSLSPYGYESPKKLKHSGNRRGWGGYYLDSQNRLKVLEGRRSYHISGPNKSEKREEKTTQNLIDYLWRMADYKKKFSGTDIMSYKNMTDPSRYEPYYYEPSFSFKHPTKTQKSFTWDKETGWTRNGPDEPISVTLKLDQFKLWAEKYNKTYFFIIRNEYITNLKWSFKQ